MINKMQFLLIVTESLNNCIECFTSSRIIGEDSPASNVGVHLTKKVVTDGTPLSIITDLQLSLAVIWASDKPCLPMLTCGWDSYGTTDAGIFVVGTIVRTQGIGSTVYEVCLSPRTMNVVKPDTSGSGTKISK